MAIATNFQIKNGITVGVGGSILVSSGNSVGIGTTTPSSALQVIGTVTGTTFSGSGSLLTSIPNSALNNSSVTINTGTGLTGGGSVSLGGSLTLASTGVTSLATSGIGISVSGSTGAVTISSGATSINTVNTIVSRDASGNFTAGTITGTTFSSSTGSTGSPSITFTGNTNTGVFSPSSNIVAVSTNGTEALRVDASGRLLVGTSSSRLVAPGTTPSLQIESGSGDVGIRRNIAIAAALPANLIIGRARGNAFESVVSGDYLGQIIFTGADGSSQVVAANIQSIVDGTPGTNNMPGNLIFGTTSNGNSSPTERLRIDSSGNVGIGTASPATKLFVAGVTGGSPVTIQGSSGNSAALAFFNNNATTNRAVMGQGFLTGSDNIAFFVNNAPADLVLATSGLERFRITSGGAVGIGITNPTQTLHVQGNSRITGSQYDSNNVAGTTGQYLQSTGTGTSWSTVIAGITITDDTSTNATRYITFTPSTSGTITTENTSSTNLTFNPSTGNLNTGGSVYSGSAFVGTATTITQNHTVTTAYNEMSVGPVTVQTGLVVTVNSGAQWTVV